MSPINYTLNATINALTWYRTNNQSLGGADSFPLETHENLWSDIIKGIIGYE